MLFAFKPRKGKNMPSRFSIGFRSHEIPDHGIAVADKREAHSREVQEVSTDYPRISKLHNRLFAFFLSQRLDHRCLRLLWMRLCAFVTVVIAVSFLVAWGQAAHAGSITLTVNPSQSTGTGSTISFEATDWGGGSVPDENRNGNEEGQYQSARYE